MTIGRNTAKSGRRYATDSLNPPAVAPEVRTVATADGATLRVCVHGRADAQPIVLSHGWCERAEYWNPQVNALAGEYRVITYDQRGHGESTLGSRRLGPDVLADDLAAVLDETLAPGERAVLAGHSLGGMTIMSWSAAHPEQDGQAGAILLHNTGYSDLIAETLLLPFIPAGAIPRALGVYILSGALRFPPVFLLRPFVKWRIMPSGGRDEVDFCTRIFKSCPPKVRGRWGRAIADLALDGPGPIPDVPTSVIAGDRDYLTPPSHARLIAAALAASGNLAHFEVFQGAGHQCNLEDADRFNAELAYLAKQVRSGASRSDIAG